MNVSTHSSTGKFIAHDAFGTAAVVGVVLVLVTTFMAIIARAQ